MISQYEKDILEKAKHKVTEHKMIQELGHMFDAKAASEQSGISQRLTSDQVLAEIAERASVYAQPFPFIDQTNTGTLQIGPGRSCAVWCASGRGKTTVALNLGLAYLIATGKPTLLITNEMSTSSMYELLALLSLGLNTSTNIANLPPDTQTRLTQEIVRLYPLVHVKGNEVAKGQSFSPMSSADGVDKVLREAAGKYGCVVLDYYQQLTSSTQLPASALPHEVQQIFVSKLDEYVSILKAPFYILAQAHPVTGGCRRSDLQASRIKGSKKLYDVAHCNIELQRFDVPVLEATKDDQYEDHETRPILTLAYVHKARYQGEYTDSCLVFQFEKGKYLFVKHWNQDQTTHMLTPKKGKK